MGLDLEGQPFFLIKEKHFEIDLFGLDFPSLRGAEIMIRMMLRALMTKLRMLTMRPYLNI